MFRRSALYTAVLLPLLCFGKFSYAAATPNDAYRDFWYPLEHGMRLSYCSEDHQECGLPLASKYCQMMGYDKASKARIDHNVGLTRYPASTNQCKGWRCDGFMFISCEESIKKAEPAAYSYRSNDFVLPRFKNYRVDWCYKSNKDCGSRAANAFCRQQGYRHATSYDKQANLPATQTVGDQELCFGKTCDGFSHITCYR
jgi:putative hemolysin|tara:strand:- start:453 stop:1049 length:597 start_codon:yes stop_codon:yes gene_type:complete